jgi:DNA repair photolyase
MGFADYTANVYAGCAFQCSYCFVPAIRSRRGMPEERPWGEWVEVKRNAAEVLRREMLRMPPTSRISIGTAADSWQPAERRYGISRRVLEVLQDYDNPISIVTRSPLIARDIDILRRFRRLRISISLPTFDDRIRSHFEPRAPSVSARCRLVKRLREAGIRVQLMFAPILPGLCDTRSAVVEYMHHAHALQVESVVFLEMGYLRWLGKGQQELMDTLPQPLRPLESSLSMEELHALGKRLSWKLGLMLCDEREEIRASEGTLFPEYHPR